MLAINGERLDLSKKDNPVVKRVLEAMDDIKKNVKFPLVIKYTSSHISAKTAGDPDSKEEHAQRVGVMNTYNISTVNGDEQWTYYTSFKKGNNIKPDMYLPRKTYITPWTVINERDIELAFFLICIGPCEKHTLMSKHQLGNVRTPEYRIHVAGHEAQLLAEARRAEAKIKGMLYEDNPAVGLSDTDIREFSTQIGLRDSASVDINVLKNQLFDMMTTGKDSRIILEKFLVFGKKDERSDIRDMVTKAIASGKIVTNEVAAGNIEIMWDEVPENEIRKIIGAKKGTSPADRLVKFYDEMKEDEQKAFVARLKLKLEI